MKPEAQQIAVAEADGFVAPFSTRRVYFADGESDGFENALYDANHRRVPDYLNDLNAMHRVEKTLGGKLNFKYQQIVACIHSGIPIEKIEAFGWDFTRIGCKPALAAIDATAAQRAEAFLRALGKWIDQD